MPLDPPPTRLELVAAVVANAVDDAVHASAGLWPALCRHAATERDRRLARFDAIRAEARRVR